MLNLIVFLLLVPFSAWSQISGLSSSSNSQPTFGLKGGATLTSNFVERGLTHTEGDPGLQGEFWFNFGPQFRLGLWGANVRYEEASTTHFWLRANADIKVDFSSETSMRIKYTENKFYRANNRNGSTIGLHFEFWGYRIVYDKDSNWEGTDDAAIYTGVGKDFAVSSDWIWTNDAGHTMPEGDGVKSFFDIRSGLGKKFKDIFLNGIVSYSTASGALKDRGKTAFILEAKVAF